MREGAQTQGRRLDARVTDREANFVSLVDLDSPTATASRRHCVRDPRASIAEMKVSELDDLVVRALAEGDHPEITKVERIAQAGDTNHTRVRVYFTDDTSAVIMVRKVEGQRVPPHADYQLPTGVI